jgi:hypothetical protein
MSQNWESTFSFWAKGPSDTESERCENSVRAIKKAIEQSDALRDRNIEVFLQGSYRNRVNVRQDSDVDVGILCRDTFFYQLPDGKVAEDLNITPATYHYSEFKNDVHQALIDYFGHDAIIRGNKAFDIQTNTYRVEADIAPFFEYRYYLQNGNYAEGVKLISDSVVEVENYPEQHYTNGVSKNSETQKKYKRVVRILKNLKNKMDDEGYATAKKVPGFFLECLCFNVPNDDFGYHTYHANVRAVLAHLFNNTMNSNLCSEWVEVNDIKYLFHTTQQWSRLEAHNFISDAWDYVGYK